MKVFFDGSIYKASRITGPSHNFLGLVFSSGAEVPLTVEALPGNDPNASGPVIVKDEVVRQVLDGVAEANRELSTGFSVAKIQYVATDTPNSSAYSDLAKRIVADAAKRSKT